MKNINLFIIITINILLLVSCRKDNTLNENEILVKINSNEKVSATNEKLLINSQQALLYWTSGDQIKLIDNANNIITLDYTGETNSVARFVNNSGSINNGNYLGFYPTSGSNISVSGYNNIVYTMPDSFIINSSNLDAYIYQNMLMYTKTKYVHGNGDTLKFGLAMTILEVELKTDFGSYTLNTIQLSGACDTMKDQIFIKRATLPNVLYDSTGLKNITYTNCMLYRISPGLTITTSPQKIKLLVWSNSSTVSNFQYYILSLNDRRIAKKIVRSTTFSNNKYYTFPNYIIKDSIASHNPVLGDFYAGGYVFHIFKPGEGGYVSGETHGLVCAVTDLGRFTWGTSGLTVSTQDSIGSGLTNTNAIVATCGTNNAASKCLDYAAYGYCDWYLPSIVELDSMHDHLNHTSCGFKGEKYWSSSGTGLPNSTQAKCILFGSQGNILSQPKSSAYYVRPIRKF